MNPADVMKAANSASMGAGNISHAEQELSIAKDKLKALKNRVEELKRNMLHYIKTVKAWQESQEKNAVFCAESIDPAAKVSKAMINWSNGVSALSLHVTSDLAQMFDDAVLEPIRGWLDEFKPLKNILKDYFEAKSSRDHYVKKMANLRMQMAKGKVKMDKLQRNTRKLAGATAEYVRLEAYTITNVKLFYDKCRNHFIQVTARHAQFQERMIKDIHSKTSTYADFAKQILAMRKPLGASNPAEAAKLAAKAAKEGVQKQMSKISSGMPKGTPKALGGNRSSSFSVSSVGSATSAASSDWGAPERQSDSSMSSSSTTGGGGGGGGGVSTASMDDDFGSFGNDDSNLDEQKGFDNNTSVGDVQDEWGDGWGETTQVQSMPTPNNNDFGMGDDWGSSNSSNVDGNSNSGLNTNPTTDDGFGNWDNSVSNNDGGFLEPAVPPLPPQSPSFSNPPPTRAPPVRPPRATLEDPFGSFEADDTSPVKTQQQQQPPPQQEQQQQQQQQQQGTDPSAASGNPFLDFF
jgi:hypothetical protein